MNLGINLDEDLILQWALDDWINHLSYEELKNCKRLFPSADIKNIQNQLNLIIQIGEEE